MSARAIAMGLLLSAGAGPSLAEPVAGASDNVEVSLVVVVSKNLSLEVDGAVSATSPRRIGFAGGAVEALTGLATGCLFMRGVDRVDLTLEGENPYGGAASGAGPFLAGSGPALGKFLYYEPVIAVGPPGANFRDNLFAAHVQPGLAGDIRSLADRAETAQRVNRVTLDAPLFAASGGSGTTATCSGGDNFAVGALIFLTETGRSALTGVDGAAHYRSVDQLTADQDLSEGTYRFSDSLTVTIAPRLD
jgi:hypothetical protein